MKNILRYVYTCVILGLFLAAVGAYAGLEIEWRARIAGIHGINFVLVGAMIGGGLGFVFLIVGVIASMKDKNN